LKVNLGIRLEKVKAPRNVLIVDHIEKKPTANWSGWWLVRGQQIRVAHSGSILTEINWNDAV